MGILLESKVLQFGAYFLEATYTSNCKVYSHQGNNTVYAKYMVT